jgi:hypothetical protein
MPNIETPSEFAQRFDPCARGEFIGVSEAVAAITVRDAAIRAESAELLRVCGEALRVAQSIKSLVQSIERGEDWEGGEPSLGTCRGFGRIKSISDEATTAMAALKKAGVME